jgi:hypothetical protein
VDAEKEKQVAFEITDGRVSDHKMAKPLLIDVKMKGTLMDAGYGRERSTSF